MGDILKGIEFLGIPMTIAIIIIGLFLILQIIGELLEFKGKAVPEFIKIRKYFKRKKEERAQQKALLEKVQQSLDEVNLHYSTDNITKRNEWMTRVNDGLEEHNKLSQDLKSLQDILESNNALILDLYINVNRNRIIDFASKIVNENAAVSREEFSRIFKVYNEYEEIIEQHGKTNGEVDVAIRIIRESYEQHMKHHTFIEDLRGYNK